MAHANEALREAAISIAQGFDLSPGSFTRLPQIELSGDREIAIEGHGGIVEYTEERIVLKCGKRLLEIEGEKLIIKAFSKEYMRAAGRIRRIEFAGAGQGKC